MQFVVEDGTGKPDANSYASVATADSYFEDAGIATWVGTQDQKQGWLVQATRYVGLRWNTRFIGTPTHSDQALHFPATDAAPYADDEVPLPLIQAVCEYALRAKSGPLAPDPAIDATGYSVVTTKKKVGPIEKSFSAMGSATAGPMSWRPYPIPDALISQLLRVGSGGNRVIR